MIAPSTEHAVREFRRLISKMNADRAVEQERYGIACEIIANYLEGANGSTGRAREMVEGQYRLRHPLVEGKAL